jgi:hypothetical protein
MRQYDGKTAFQARLARKEKCLRKNIKELRVDALANGPWASYGCLIKIYFFTFCKFFTVLVKKTQDCMRNRILQKPWNGCPTLKTHDRYGT